MKYLAARLEVGEHRRPLADAREVLDARASRPRCARWRAGAARRWSRPPSVITKVMAFSKASRVRMSRGVMPRLIMCITALPASKQSSSFRSTRPPARSCSAGTCRAPRCAGHGVRGVHAAARACAGDACSSIRRVPCRDLAAACLPTASNTVTMSASSCPARRSRADGAAVDEHARAVQPRHGHQAAGHVLVAAADGHEAVHAFAAHHGLDRVRDHLARHQRYFMPSVPIEMPSEMVMVLKMIALAAGGVHALRPPWRAGRCACCTG